MRTGTIKCNQWFIDNQLEQVIKLMDATVMAVADDPLRKGTKIISMKSAMFDIDDSYPEYILHMTAKSGELEIVSVKRAE